MNKKAKLLVTISFSFSIRYIVRTGLLEKLKTFAEPVVIITWEQKELMEELTAAGYQVYVLPPVKQGTLYNNARRKIDYWFTHFQLKNYRKIQERYTLQFVSLKTRILKQAVKQYNICKLHLPAIRQQLFKQEKELLITDTNYEGMLSWVQHLHADAVFTVTPFHIQEDLFLRACKHAGLKMLTAILSFDNITKRGWIPVDYDLYMVWNRYNKEELQTIYPNAQYKPVHITGAPQFDFYYNKKWLLPKGEWMRSVGVENEHRKIILYAGGPAALFPHEPQYLQHIVTAIEEGSIKNNPVVLFRVHPMDDINRWKKAVGERPYVVYDTSWTGTKKLQNTNVTCADVKKLCSTLAYTHVHVNLCSTMTVDGSAFNKPQIGPAYDDVNSEKAHLLKNLYRQKHFLPILDTGELQLANSKKELIQFINEALEKDNEHGKRSSGIVKEIITYTDGLCMQRAAGALQQALIDT